MKGFFLFCFFIFPVQAFNFYDSSWSKSSWSGLPKKQLPTYNAVDKMEVVKRQLEKKPPLIFVEEADTLQRELIQTSKGNAFTIIMGDCVETFDNFSVENIKDFSKLIFQIGIRVSKETGMKAVKIGRIAGQYAKPRSQEYENGILSYKGDIIHGYEANDRDPDAGRMLEAYYHSVSTLNLLRAFSKGGFAALNNVDQWKIKSVDDGTQQEFLLDLQEHLRLLKGLGIPALTSSVLQETNLYIGHECLLLPYEESLTRVDSKSFRPYSCSAHFLWIGERTRDLDGAHVEFIRGIHNPIGIKVSADFDEDEIIGLLKKVNPFNQMGKVVLMTRFGRNFIHKLPDLIRTVEEHKCNVVWVCDPMHGNTFSKDGYKVRCMEDIEYEMIEFFKYHKLMGTVAGGIHLESTSRNVSEIINTVDNSIDPARYETKCDPRLNGTQTLQLMNILLDYMSKN